MNYLQLEFDIFLHKYIKMNQSSDEEFNKIHEFEDEYRQFKIFSGFDTNKVSR